MKKVKGFVLVFGALAMALCFTSTALAANPDSQVDISAFALKDGRVYKGGKALDGDVNEVPAEIGGSIRYWSALDADENEALSEVESGVWFFAASGEALTFAPLESASSACQEVIFSPDGGMFVIAWGSSVRPDLFFEVYGQGTKKLTDLAGTRGGLAWVDPVRFVMTRIDDARADADDAVVGLRVSVVLVDVAAGETVVLKEATATQNFWLETVVEDGKAVTVREDSVKAEQDWADEDKITSQNLRVEIPAAG